MGWWFAYRVNAKGIDIHPGTPQLEGPFDSYQEAKVEKERNRGPDMEQTSVFKAGSSDEARALLAHETWTTL